MATKQSPRSAKVRPVHEIRIGRIKAAIWANETEFGIRHNVTLSRLYRDPEQPTKWLQTTSLGRDDLLTARKVLDLAHSWTCDQQIESNGQATEESEEENGEVHF